MTGLDVAERRPRWHVGDKVRTRMTVKPKRYAGRTGTVAEIRRTSPRDAPARYEVGVTIGGPTVWFRAGELVAA